MTPAAALALERFLNDTALGFCWGSGGFLSSIAVGEVRPALQTSMRRSLLFSTVMAAVTSLVAVPIQASSITSTWASAGQLEIVMKVAFGTSSGFDMLLHAVICTALFAATCLSWSRISVALAACSLGSLATFGHPGDDVVNCLVTVVHILSATAWVGGLVPFLLLLPMANRPALRADAVRSMQRFSTAGHIAVGLALLSGLANTLLILGHLPTDPLSPYQFELLIKIAAVLAMTCLALANRYVVVPRCRSDPILSCKLLMFGASIEIALCLLAFAMVASFGLEDPT